MLTKAKLRKLYRYDPKSGAFVYRKTRGRYKAGQPAGSVQITVSHRLKVGNKNYHLGPVIHRYMTGKVPRGIIDHKNGDRSDFRWGNLRDVSHHANAINSPSRPNKTGYAGVEYTPKHYPSKPYRAVVWSKRKRVWIGHFSTADKAGRAYLKKKRELHGEYLRQAR